MDLNFVGVKELVSRYVKAILVLATNYKVIDVVYADFKKMEQIFFDDASGLSVLNGSSINKETKQKVLHEVAKTLNLHKLTTELLLLMLANGRFYLVRHCIKLFFMEYNRLNNILDIVIVSSEAIEPKEKANIENKLSKKIESKLECSYKIDPKIFSGLILKIGGFTYDFSAKSRLNFILQKSIEKISQLS